MYVVTNRFPYHVEQEDDVVLSLQFVNPERKPVEQRRESLAKECPDSADFGFDICSETLDQEVFGLYTAEIHPRAFSVEELERLSPDEQILVDTVIDGFRTIEGECREAGRPLDWYKQPEIPKIIQAFERTQWRQPVAEVGGRLFSNLLLEHPLPNANHRTAVSVVETYLQSISPDVGLPATGEPGEWYEWSREYIRESKRLLTLRRKTAMFRHLREWGCDEIERKNKNVISFSDYELDCDDPRSYYREQHLDLGIEFVEKVLNRTNHEHLINVEDSGKATFVSRLKA